MGNAASNPILHDATSDRELARQLLENKRIRSVQFAESDVSIIDGGPPSSDDASQSLHAKNLRSNLMRVQNDRDPMVYYEILRVVGVGSMGSVAMVRKRDEMIGGSARRNLVKSLRRQKNANECFRIPIVGELFRQCFEAVQPKRNSNHDSSRVYSHQDESINSAYDHESSESSGTKKVSPLYALKSIHLNRLGDDSFVDELKNEIEILKSLDHPYIVRPIETFNHRNQLYIVMELCSGGDLYSRDPYTEDEAARIVGSILSAVSFMHHKKIVHRDLKYENILFANSSPMAEIKLIDFGLSKKYVSEKELTEGVGTIYTMAPEVLKGTYTSQADLWSVGVVAYMLLSSQMPFFGQTRRQIVEKIMECEYDFSGRRWKRVSHQARSFVKDLLVLDPDDRANADEANQSMWLNKRHVMSVRGPTPDEVDAIIGTIVKYADYSDLKKLALMVIAHKSTSSEIGILRKVFQQYDIRKDGTIRLPEFRVAMNNYGLPEKEINRLFDAVDLDGTGKIRYTEFLAATIESHGVIDEEKLAEAFDRLDCDDSGFISAANLRELLGNDFPEWKIQAIIKEADLTLDNQISYPEFLALWEDSSQTTATSKLSELDSSAGMKNEIPIPESKEKKLLRAESEAESGKLGRVNFLESKQLSERKAEHITTFDIKQAPLLVLNAIDEIVEDPEISDDYNSTGYIGFHSLPSEITKSNASYAASEMSRDSYEDPMTFLNDLDAPTTHNIPPVISADV